MKIPAKSSEINQLPLDLSPHTLQGMSSSLSPLSSQKEEKEKDERNAN
jgi:hypothetical protein